MLGRRAPRPEEPATTLAPQEVAVAVAAAPVREGVKGTVPCVTS